MPPFFTNELARIAHASRWAVIAAVAFVMIYSARLAYQAYLLRHRDKSGEKGEWGEILLVLIPKNILVVLTPYFLLVGVPMGIQFIIGSIVFLAGIGLRFKALHDLGDMYSLNVDMRSGHKLVVRGTFSLIRHPLYLAYILDTAGIALVLQQLLPWTVVLAVTLGWLIRIRHEERSLKNVFGSEYDRYIRAVPALNILEGIRRKLFPRNISHYDSHNLIASTSTIGGKRNAASAISDAEKLEIEIHLAEYNALSEFQRDAKASFVRIALYHNTGIVVAIAWALQQINSAGGLLPAVKNNDYLLPIFLALPVVNAVLIIGCGYQVYSFFCVARHFQALRHRLVRLVGQDVLAYEDKFRQVQREKELSLFLDVLAGAVWFVIPITLALTVALGARIWLKLPTTAAIATYWVGTVLSVVAGVYLVGVVALMLKTQAGRANTTIEA